MTQYLTFLVEDEYFAINISSVFKIADTRNIVRVPMQASFVAGVMPVMGRQVPVLDMHHVLDKPELTNDDPACVLVIDIEATKVGFVVDKMDDAIIMSDSELPEYLTFLEPTKLLSERQMKAVKELENWTDERKSVNVKPVFKKQTRNHAQ